MRSAGNFHPEWGYLAPAPSFLRTARIALVATAIGATAGAVVVVSLVERPGSNDDNTSIAAHALVTSAPVIVAPGPPPAVNAMVGSAPTPLPSPGKPAVAAERPMVPPLKPAVAAAQPTAPQSEPAAARTQSPVNHRAGGIAAAASKQTPLPAVAASAAATETPPAIAGAEPVPAQHEDALASGEDSAKKIPGKKRHSAKGEAARRWQAASNARRRWRDDHGFTPLLRLFSFRGLSSWSN